MAVPAVWRLINLLAFIEPKQHANSQAGRLCSSPKIQKQAAFGMICRLLVMKMAQCSRLCLQKSHRVSHGSFFVTGH